MPDDTRRCLARFFAWGAAPTVDAYCWDAIYALTLDGDRIGAGRRYYDQAALVAETETFAVPLSDGRLPGDRSPERAPGGREPIGGATPDRAANDRAAIDLATRTTAWNRRDGAALAAPLGPVRLHMAGVARPLEHASEVAAALAAFASRSDGLRLAPGAMARTPAGTAIEWVGSVGVGTAARRFALVEFFTPSPSPASTPGEWRILFNTYGL